MTGSPARPSASLFLELRGDPPPADLRDALARALRDPSLTLAYWLPEFGSYADLDGRPVALAGPEDGARAMTLIDRDGARVAALDPRSGAATTSRSCSTPSPRRPASRSRTGGCTPSCEPAWRSCGARARE